MVATVKDRSRGTTALGVAGRDMGGGIRYVKQGGITPPGPSHTLSNEREKPRTNAGEKRGGGRGGSQSSGSSRRPSPQVPGKAWFMAQPPFGTIGLGPRRFTFVATWPARNRR